MIIHRWFFIKRKILEISSKLENYELIIEVSSDWKYFIFIARLFSFVKVKINFKNKVIVKTNTNQYVIDTEETNFKV